MPLPPLPRDPAHKPSPLMLAVGNICRPVQRVRLCSECFARPVPLMENTCGAPECVASFNRWLDEATEQAERED
jgi:hypothetical protein